MSGLTIQYAKIPETKRKSPLLIQRTKSSQPIKTPADRILSLQRTIGNQAVQRLIKSGTLQAKLKIGQSGDKYEQEADRVADAVMRMPEPGVQRQVDEEEETLQAKPLAEQITPLIQRQVEEDKEIRKQPEEEEEVQGTLLQREANEEEEVQKQPGEEETLQVKVNGGISSTVTHSVESGIKSIRGGSQPLPVSTRAFFEPRFGTDFSGVRVHTDGHAASTAKSVNAKAFTVGYDVVFGAGQYMPDNFNGQKLLAHELTHVIQQNGGGIGKAKRTPNPFSAIIQRLYKPNCEKTKRLPISETAKFAKEYFSETFIKNNNSPTKIVVFMDAIKNPSGQLYNYSVSALNCTKPRIFGVTWHGSLPANITFYIYKSGKHFLKLETNYLGRVKACYSIK